MSRFDEYLQNVVSQVRVKRIRDTLTHEMRDHMELQKADYLAEGMPEDEAEARTVQEMGDALMVGSELDRVHRPRTQWKGILAALAVMLLGALLRVFLYSNEGRIYVQADMGLSILLGAGIVGLLSATDYTWWLKLTWPVWILWMLCGLHAIISGPSDGLVTLRLPFIVPLLERLTPEMITSVMPLMTALLMCRMRGRGWGGFLTGLTAIGMGLLIGSSYIRYSLRYYPMAVMLFISLGMALYAVKRGFFRIDRKRAYGLLGTLAVLVLIRLLAGPAPVTYRDTMGELVYPVLKKAQMIGGAALEAEAVQGLRGWQYLLPFMIVRFGWIPFAVLLAGIVLALVWCVMRFWKMENRMGALLGLTAVMTMGAQTVLYLLYSFTNISIDIGLPLISEGMVMMLADSVLVGVMLSVLRGENLPEERTPGRMRRTA